MRNERAHICQRAIAICDSDKAAHLHLFDAINQGTLREKVLHELASWTSESSAVRNICDDAQCGALDFNGGAHDRITQGKGYIYDLEYESAHKSKR
jgi:hypothetical protein